VFVYKRILAIKKMQVKALQKGFSMLSDAVIEELDSMRQEGRRWQEERSNWAATIQQLSGKLAAVDAMRDEVDRFKCAPIKLKHFVSTKRKFDLQQGICSDG
jgi:hypothetical protein